MAKRDREFPFTINNYTADCQRALKELGESDKILYLVYSNEEGELTHTPHIQGYVYFIHAKTMSAANKLLGNRASFDPRGVLGTPKQNRDYIVGPWTGIDHKTGLPKSKPYNPNYHEFGTMPQQGKRNDIDAIRDQLKERPAMREVVETAKSYQSVKMAELYLKYKEKKRSVKPVVIWYYGDTGTGKSETALTELDREETYECPRTGRWFDGYDAHKYVLIDDVRDDFMPYSELLKFCDKVPFRVETKGGTRQMLAEAIIFTSPHDPITCLTQNKILNEDPKQFLDRIDYIVEFRGESHRTHENPIISKTIIKQNKYYTEYLGRSGPRATAPDPPRELPVGDCSGGAC